MPSDDNYESFESFLTFSIFNLPFIIHCFKSKLPVDEISAYHLVCSHIHCCHAGYPGLKWICEDGENIIISILVQRINTWCHYISIIHGTYTEISSYFYFVLNSDLFVYLISMIASMTAFYWDQTHTVSPVNPLVSLHWVNCLLLIDHETGTLAAGWVSHGDEVWKPHNIAHVLK